MHLTQEQLDALRSGESVRLQEAGTDLVVVRADTYEHMRHALAEPGDWLDDAMDPDEAESDLLLGWGAEDWVESDSPS
jgi:hypothetical protein